MAKRGLKIGRPPKIDSVTTSTIERAIKAGNYIETAAAAAGVSRSTLYEWLRVGAREKALIEKGETPSKEYAEYVSFSDIVKKAIGYSEVRDVAIIASASETQWQAAAWRLERRFHERWGRKQAIIHGGNVKVSGGAKQEGISSSTADEIRADLLGVGKVKRKYPGKP